MSPQPFQVHSPSPAAATIWGAHDPQALMRIKHLQLRARAVVEGFYSGLHRSPLHGISVEFSEYRPYTPGDDPRGLDWKLYARSDRYFVKQFEAETNRQVYLVVDRSRSMAFGSLDYDKADYAVTLAATLALYMTMQRDSVGLLTFDETVGQLLPARQRRGHFRQLLVGLSRPLAGTATDLDAPLQQLAQLIRRRGLMILISDLLAPLTTLQPNLAMLRSRGHEVIILRVLDRAELDLPGGPPVVTVDMESGRQMYLDPQVAREQYRQRFGAHRQSLRNICDSLGVDLHDMVTDQPLAEALMQLVMRQRMRRSRTLRRGMVAPAAVAAGPGPGGGTGGGAAAAGAGGGGGG